MRRHGTHACFVHGPAPGSNGGCRCEPCRDANRRYERQRKRRKAPAYVAAGQARAHLRMLSAAGLGLKTVAQRSGVSHGALAKIVYGDTARGQAPSRRIRAETASRILAVTPADAADGGRIDATATWRHVDELLGRGWTKVAIAGAIGQKGPGLQLGRSRVTARSARAVAALLDEPVPPRRSRWGTRPQPEPEPEPERVKVRPVLHDALGGVADARSEPWRARAACRLPDVPTWMFFPGRGDDETVAAAKAVCASCPVTAECLAAHLGEPVGIWGGTTGRQRRRLRRERAA